MPVNDLVCRDCRVLQEDALYRNDARPACPVCHRPMEVSWEHGRPPATDLHEARHFDGLDAQFTSARQAERAAQRRAREWTADMQRRGLNLSWEIQTGGAGDKRGGARDVRRKRGSAFAYQGQRNRQSTGERRTTS